MHSVRCTAGHPSRIDFGDDMQRPCPECGISVYKFRDQAEAVQAPAENDMPAGASKGARSLPNGAAGKIGILLFGSALLITLWAVKRPVVAADAVATASVLPIAGSAKSLAEKPPAVQVPSTPTVRIADVHIRDLQILAVEGDAVRVKFMLATDGPSDTPFPTLQVNWDGSASPPLVISNSSYSHPSTFSTFEVTTEFQKPADATGLTISIKG